MIALVLALTVFAGVFIPWAHRYDLVMSELEGLDDESLAEVMERGGR